VADLKKSLGLAWSEHLKSKKLSLLLCLNLKLKSRIRPKCHIQSQVQTAWLCSLTPSL